MRRYKTIRSHFMNRFILMLLIPVALIGGLQSFLLFRSTYQNINNRMISSVTNTNLYFELVVQNIENLANSISFNNYVQTLIKSGFLIKEGWQDKHPDEFRLWQQARDSLKNIFITHHNISNVVIFNDRGNVILTLYKYDEYTNIVEYSWFDSLPESSAEIIWVGGYMDRNDFNASNLNVISLAKKILILDTDKMGSNYGYLLINIRADDLYDTLINFKVSKKSDLLVQDENHIIVSKSMSEKVNSPSLVDLKSIDGSSGLIRRNKKYSLLAYNHNKTTGWDIVEIADINTLFSDNFIYLFYTIILNLILLIAFFMLSVKLSQSISSPIKMLHSKIKKIESGNFDLKVVEKYHIDEIDKLMERFIVMASRLKGMLDKSVKSELKEKEMENSLILAELKSLQQQMNPHFLYNTLNSISCMASLGSSEEVVEMINALSELYRFSMKKDTTFIPVSAEVENVKNYIYIQKIRLGPKLASTIELGSDVSDCLTMKFLLQPLVENAILHGIKNKAEGGKITIKIYKECDDLIYLISDDGIGMSQIQIDNILNSKNEENIGLRNVIKRIRLFFQERASVNIISSLGMGTTIKIKMPCYSDMKEIENIVNNIAESDINK